MKNAYITTSVVTLGILIGPAMAQDTELTMNDAIAIALKAQPGTVEEAERDQFNGRVVAEIEIVNEAGEEIELAIDLASGEILSIVTDDDPTDDPDDTVLEDVTFLVPGNPGGGWDKMSRSIGQAFTTTGIVDDLFFQNRGGNNGGVGLSYMIENAQTLSKTVMLNTTQIVVRSLNGTYSDSYAELVPVAAPIGDFAAFIVHPDSDIISMEDLVEAYQNNAAGFAIGGGSAPGDMDHLVSAMVMQAAGVDPTIDYVQFDAPEPAFAALVAGEVMSLTTQYTQALALADQGIVRIIGVTAPDDFDLPSDIPGMTEQNIEMEFVTWVGFFAPPGTEPDQVEPFQTAFSELYKTDAWKTILADNGGIALQLDSDAFASLLETQQADMRAALRAIATN